MIKVSSGSYQGKTLLTPPKNITRPTSSKVRASLFNILRNQITGSKFGDFFCGSGAIGIESLSQEASHCTLIDSNRKAFLVAQNNCKNLAPDSYTLLHKDALHIAKSNSYKNHFDFLFLDPPFQDDIFSNLDTIFLPLVKKEGLLIIQYPKKLDPSWENKTMQIKKYGDSNIAFIRHS